jgi:putative flippase GtrA
MTLALRALAGEGARYLGASAAAFALDFGIYVALIRLAHVHYLVAAPAGFCLGLVLVYQLSVRWVFVHRRLADRRAEFVVFALIGVAGVTINELVIYAGVEGLSLSPELAKILSAGIVFCTNFVARKMLLFRRRAPA